MPPKPPKKKRIPIEVGMVGAIAVCGAIDGSAALVTYTYDYKRKKHNYLIWVFRGKWCKHSTVRTLAAAQSTVGVSTT